MICLISSYRASLFLIHLGPLPLVGWAACASRHLPTYPVCVLYVVPGIRRTCDAKAWACRAEIPLKRLKAALQRNYDVTRQAWLSSASESLSKLYSESHYRIKSLRPMPNSFDGWDRCQNKDLGTYSFHHKSTIQFRWQLRPFPALQQTACSSEPWLAGGLIARFYVPSIPSKKWVMIPVESRWLLHILQGCLN